MKIFEYKEIESTQLKAKELSLDTSMPFVVLAESQTNGKGTKDRTWFSPSGGLYFTLALELEINLLKIDIAKFSQESCVLVVEVLREILLESFIKSNLGALSIKPINDLYFDDAKLAGVLLESINKNQHSILFVGLGLNVSKVENSSLNRKIISLEEILDKEELANFNKVGFSEKLAIALKDRLQAL